MKKLFLVLLLLGPIGPSVLADTDNQLVTEVRDLINEVSPEQWADAEIQKALNRELLSRTASYLLMEEIDTTSISTTSGVAEYALPANFVAPFLIFVAQGSRWEPIKPVGENLKQKPQGTDLTYYLIFKKRIRFISPPTASGRKIYLWYFKQATAMTFTGVECALDDDDEDIIVYGAAGRLLKKLRDANSRAAGSDYRADAADESTQGMRRHLIWLVSQNENLINFIPKSVQEGTGK